MSEAPGKRHARLRLEQALSRLPPSERRVADAILRAPEIAVIQSVAQLAHAAAVSPSSVTRLCQALGYRGTHEFMIHLARDLTPSTPASGGPIAISDSADEVRDKLVRAAIDTLSDTAELVRGDLLSDCASAIARARRIQIYGLGASAAVAQDAAHKLLKLGLWAANQSDIDLMGITSAALGDGDLAVGISHTGRTQPVVDAIVQARAAGAATLAITHDAASPLAARTELVLTYAARRTPLSEGSMSGRLAQLMLVDILYTLIAHAEFDRRATLAHRADRLAGSRRAR